MVRAGSIRCSKRKPTPFGPAATPLHKSSVCAKSANRTSKFSSSHVAGPVSYGGAHARDSCGALRDTVGPAARADRGERARGDVEAIAVRCPREEHLGARSKGQREHRSERHGVPQTAALPARQIHLGDISGDDHF